MRTRRRADGTRYSLYTQRGFVAAADLRRGDTVTVPIPLPDLTAVSPGLAPAPRLNKPLRVAVYAFAGYRMDGSTQVPRFAFVAEKAARNEDDHDG